MSFYSEEYSDLLLILEQFKQLENKIENMRAVYYEDEHKEKLSKIGKF